MEAKLDELLRAVEQARADFIGIEHLTEEEIEDIRARLEKENDPEGKKASSPSRHGAIAFPALGHVNLSRGWAMDTPSQDDAVAENQHRAKPADRRSYYISHGPRTERNTQVIGINGAVIASRW